MKYQEIKRGVDKMSSYSSLTFFTIITIVCVTYIASYNIKIATLKNEYNIALLENGVAPMQEKCANLHEYDTAQAAVCMIYFNNLKK